MNTLKYCYLFLLAIVCFPIASEEYIQPPHLPASDQAVFSEWIATAESKSADAVFDHASGKHLNILVKSASPYLRQHAKNPINWKPWREKYLKLAKKENKLIFLSIGYSTCHWCHVMKKESFSQVDVAASINRSYIAIKVDREELPQLDSYYASLLEAVKGSAGWPITAIINSDGLPIYIDSYVTKDKLIKLLTRVESSWETNPDFLLSTAKNISSLVEKSRSYKDSGNSLDGKKIIESARVKVLNSLDAENGGLAGKVKFPQEAMLLYLLDLVRREFNSKIDTLLTLQLNNMMNGGLRDHIDGGFHRYSTDQHWNIPHYEKMLYNQALMAQVYLEAWQVFHDENYRFVARETLDFVLAKLYSEGEGFYSALDADFNEQEGAYYLWDKGELKNALKVEGVSTYSFKKKQADGVKSSGSYLGVLTELSLRSDAMSKALEELSQIRSSRGELHRDEKIITSWNGLMIYSLAMASREFEESNYLKIAEEVAEHIWKTRFNQKSGLLYRTSDRSQELFSEEDYAYLSRAYLGLYDVTQKEIWLKRAKTIYSASNSTIVLSKALLPVGNDNASSSLIDGELLSPKAVLNLVAVKLEERTTKFELLVRENADLREVETSLMGYTGGSYYSLLYLNWIYNGSSQSDRYFAKGTGILNIVCNKTVQYECIELALNFKLKEGWHINSNKPLQDYLKPTVISGEEQLTINYPKPAVVKLGFQEEPLSVYEGIFTISVRKNRSNGQQASIQLPLQACNDEICLKPETLQIRF